MSVDSGWTTEAALAAFDDHLRRARGLCAGTRVNYARWVRAFLDERYPDGRVQVEELGARDVIEFIGAASRRYQPKTLELVATSLRSFFRFLRAEACGDRHWRPWSRWCRTGGAESSGIWIPDRSSS